MKKKFFIAFIVSLIGFSLLYSNLWKSILSDEPSVAHGDEPGKTEPEDVKKPKVKDEVLFLLMGVDAEDVKKSKGTRTDTMILTKVNFDTGKISMLSIPRDTRVLVKGKEDKINHAHAYGGPNLTMDTVEDFLHLDLDYYVKVDYKVVMGIVEAIGGVEIDVPFHMKYYDNTAGFPLLDIDIKKGNQVLMGKDAHDFLRFRKGSPGYKGYPEGDIGRIKAQQYFMKELIKQTLKPKNLLKLPKLAETYFENVETNVPWSVILKGIASANKIDVDEMVTGTIPGEGKRISGIDYFIYYREETKQIVLDMFGDYLIN
ncbi:MAG: LCP family protein [Tissierellia bacterium]|nr:LCP family protein [Tissierellia bacterium]